VNRFWNTAEKATERDSRREREREREKSVTRLSTNIETSEKIKSFYIMTKEGQKKRAQMGLWETKETQGRKEGRKEDEDGVVKKLAARFERKKKKTLLFGDNAAALQDS
jgi:hypothetical protein